MLRQVEISHWEVTYVKPSWCTWLQFSLAAIFISLIQPNAREMWIHQSWKTNSVNLFPFLVFAPENAGARTTYFWVIFFFWNRFLLPSKQPSQLGLEVICFTRKMSMLHSDRFSIVGSAKVTSNLLALNPPTHTDWHTLIPRERPLLFIYFQVCLRGHGNIHWKLSSRTEMTMAVRAENTWGLGRGLGEGAEGQWRKRGKLAPIGIKS